MCGCLVLYFCPQYKECIPAFQLSLKINSLQVNPRSHDYHMTHTHMHQEGVWFSLGCAAQQVEDLDLALRAFQRCVSLEADVRGQHL